MNTHTLLADLRQRGVNLSLFLDVDAPAGAITEADRQVLTQMKPRVLLLLAMEAVLQVEGLGVVAELMEEVYDREERAGIQST